MPLAIDIERARKFRPRQKEERKMKNSHFPEIKGRFGFGCMRFPTLEGGEVDTAEVSRMFDAFLEAGFNYFDTAHGYHGGRSETTLKTCLTSRYPRDRYIITNKLSSNHFEREEDIRPLFESQLEAVGVDYFDFYFMHAQDQNNFKKYKAAHAYETAMELKKEGKIRHLGISFHDRAYVLDNILTEYPEIEVAQIQFNYLDFDDPSVESRKCYEVCRKHGIPAMVMEPVKGGQLVNLPPEGDRILRSLGGGSNASYAIRFAAGFDGVAMVLSGMGSMEMVQDNIGAMKDFRPLSEEEMAGVKAVADVFRAQNLIQCTACGYCTERCPKNIPIPAYFACYNTVKTIGGWSYYSKLKGDNVQGKIDDCIDCGACERACPQKLEIRSLLKEVKNTFEENK
jgi:predicted aldo/keto reductase-like oxidoreductase